MGNQIALLKNPDELIKILLPHLSYCKTLSDAPLVKTTMCSTSNEGHIVAKFFMDGFINQDFKSIQQNQSNDPLQEQLKKMIDFQNKLDLRLNPNILALNPKLISKENQSFLIAYRQFIYFSLLQKSRNKIPKLTIQEKKWLIFQLLCAVSQIHKQDFKHGDIKPDNILITSNNQLFLTDFVCYKPAYVEADDLKTYTLYFGELENHNRCYFAPERFCDPEFNKLLMDNTNLKKSMDVFSVGCVIAEILMDGVPLFQRSRLFKYKRQTYNPRGNLKKKIHEPALVDLIMKMINLNEIERPTIDDSLAMMFSEKILPNSFQ